ncbi:MAG: SAM-dependent methyltransferase [Chloroflexi bacterium]|nr:SAM-dependent methyltransferase [Chloroflexota bacterium]HCU80151.1 SAM-dependent methyltransferase [Chloroflexota bacterium]
MKLIRKLFGMALSNILGKKLLEESIDIITPDGQSILSRTNTSNAAHTLVVNKWSFFWDMLTGYDLGLAESYIKGKWDHNDLTSLFKYLASKTADNNLPSIGNIAPKKMYARLVQRFKSTNSIKWAKRNISQHYDMSNDFFKTFLDPSMTYSCGIFETSTSSLEDAQYQKINTLIERSKLSSSDSILDIGCGWGSLSTTIASNHGANVTAVTLSQRQYEYFHNLLKKNDLKGNVDLQITDYRFIKGQFDHIFSVEMLEAVGHKGTQEFFQKCASLLKNGGTLQIQVITIPHSRYDAYKNNCDFIQKYIFPGGLLLSLETIKHAAHAAGFTIYNESSIGLHYAKTLSHWRKNFMQNYDTILELGFEATDIRRFLYYFCYCEGAFLSDAIDDHQLSFRKD